MNLKMTFKNKKRTLEDNSPSSALLAFGVPFSPFPTLGLRQGVLDFVDYYRKVWVVLAVGCLIVELFMITPKPVQAQVPIAYNAVSNTILLGDEAGLSTSASSPSRSVLTIAQLSKQLKELGHEELLIKQEKEAWLLKANLVLNGSVRLEITERDLKWLRLESTEEREVFIRSQKGASLLIEGMKVTSWDSKQKAVDERYQDGRSYLLASEGGELEVLSAEVAYLGWRTGEFGGLAWQGRLHEHDANTGASGRVEESTIHHNFVGLSANQANKLIILRNQVYQNVYYGIEIENGSSAFDVRENTISENGHHGLVIAKQSRQHQIHDNELSANLGHGMLLREAADENSLINNTISQNKDGIRLSHASNNLIEGNALTENGVGVRIHATFAPDEASSDASGASLSAINNQVSGNMMENNHQYGIYLYDGADENVIRDNTIEGSNLHGVYVKSDRNLLRGNTIQANGHGITILGVMKDNGLASQANEASNESSGRQNIMQGNTVRQNNGTGIRLLGAANTLIGQDEAEPREEDRNLIEGNGMDGIVIREASTGSVSTDNQVLGNTIGDNARHGVLVHGATSQRNMIMQNSITNNLSFGIKIQDGANNDVRPPRITIINPDTGYIGGQTWPNALVEVYHDADGEGEVYDGQTVADAQGFWGFTLLANPYLASVIAIDAEGNSTEFSAEESFLPQYTVQPDKHDQPTIRVRGRNAVVTLRDIRNGLGGYAYLLEEQGSGVWQLNANLRIERDVTLNLTQASGVRELRLRSQNPLEGEEEGENDKNSNEIDYSSFVYLRTHNGIINIEGVKVYSWDPETGDYDHLIENGRSYILAKYAAELNVRNAEISYLGSTDGESYGLSWRDINEVERPELLRSRVTGEVINSRIHHNYYGIYTFQASSMRFEDNFFYNNIRYGFDPHDYTHDVVVERNEAYNNGSHGFIISRGCQDFTFRDNKSFNNHDPTKSLAHGFMLDPGSPQSRDPQAPSTENLLERNEAYNNEGYGLRVLGSTDNVIQENHFHDNLHGVVLDEGSVANMLRENTLNNHVLNGLFVRGGADHNQIINNTTMRNENHGISINSNHNLIQSNDSHHNLGAGMVFVSEEQDEASDSLLIEGNEIMSNSLSDNQDDGLVLKGLVNSVIQDNIIERNAVHGVYLSEGSHNNQLFGNTLRENGGVGIRMGGGTFGNHWSQNQLYDNKVGGIDSTTRKQIEPPRITQVQGQQLTGTAPPGSRIEIYSDNGEQGRYFEGHTIAGLDGRFTFVTANKWQAKRITAITTDLAGSSSRFAISKRAPAASVASNKPSVAEWVKEFVTKFDLNDLVNQ